MKPTHVADAVSGVAVIATIAGWLPPLAAALGIIWYCIQISESKRFAQVVALAKGLWRKPAQSQD